MIITVSITKGFEHAIINNLQNADSDIQISHMNHQNEQQSISIEKDKINQIEALKSVSRIDEVVQKSGIINKNQNIQAIIIKGVEYNYKSQLIKESIIEGSYFSKENDDDLIISKYQAQKLELKLGDNCLLYFLSNNNNIQKRKFKIIGIYDMKNAEFNKHYSFGKKKNIQQIYKWNSKQVSNYEITLNNKDWWKNNQTNTIEFEINKILPYDLEARSIKSRFPGLLSWVELFKGNVTFILIIMSFICVVNMSTALLILILERLQMIGILKSLGSTRNSIRKIFIYNSWSISIKGIILGNLIGLFLCILQNEFQIISLNPDSYFVNTLPISFDITKIVLINGCISAIFDAIIPLVVKLYVCSFSLYSINDLLTSVCVTASV